MAAKRKNNGFWGKVFSTLGLLIALSILVWLGFYVAQTPGLAAMLGGVKPLWLLAAALCIPAFEALDTCIYVMMGRAGGCRVSPAKILDAVVIGEFYYRLGPAGAPVQLGLLVSAGYSLPVAGSVYTWKAVANTVVYTGYAVAALFCRVFLFDRPTEPWAIWAVGVLVGVYVALCAAVAALSARPDGVKRLAARVLSALAARIPPLAREGRVALLLGKLEEFADSLHAVKGDPRLLMKAVCLMLLELTALFAIPAFLYLALGLTGFSFAELLLTQCLVMVLSRVVMIPGNAGGAEGSFYLFMAPLFGATLPVALVLWRCAAFVEVMLLGGVWSVIRVARSHGRRVT